MLIQCRRELRVEMPDSGKMVNGQWSIGDKTPATVYQFADDGNGRFVCNVENTHHAARFLSIPEQYSEAAQGKQQRGNTRTTNPKT